MKKIEILKPVIFVVATGLSLSSYSQTQKSSDTYGIALPQARTSIAVRVPKSKKLDLSDIPVDEFLQKVLKSYGVSIDQQSEIKYHEENSHIDLNCFNCVIMSDNKSGGDRRF